MTLDIPNYYNSEDRRLYNELIQKGLSNLTPEEDMFFKEMYHQEEYACGLDGRDEYEDYMLGDDDEIEY